MSTQPTYEELTAIVQVLTEKAWIMDNKSDSHMKADTMLRRIRQIAIRPELNKIFTDREKAA